MTNHPFGGQIGGKKLPVAVLGATGAVGQTFIRLLQNHPWFDLQEVAASSGRPASHTVRQRTG
jgi:aspartate-semialdehyde dehydrogenase